MHVAAMLAVTMAILAPTVRMAHRRVSQEQVMPGLGSDWSPDALESAPRNLGHQTPTVGGDDVES